MKNLEQQGVCNKWVSFRKRNLKAGVDWIETHDKRNCDFMRNYAETGALPAHNPDFGPPPEVDPTMRSWENEPEQWLRMYCSMRAFEMEYGSLKTGCFDTVRASHAFSAAYTGEMIWLNKLYLFPKRFEGRFLDRGWIPKPPYIALGMVIGCHEQATILSRLFLEMSRLGYFSDLYRTPCYLCMFRLMADYLGEPQLPVRGRALAYPTYIQLVENWRNPDPQALVPLCLAACDLHTYLVREQPDKVSGDFQSMEWSYIPIEVLLLFKLRQLIGLQNPVLDHPLMNTALGILPEETPFEPDELTKALRERMVMDGYDEAAIARRILTNEYNLPGRPLEALK